MTQNNADLPGLSEGLVRAATEADWNSPDVTLLGTLELREEMVEVKRERSPRGQVTVRREVQTRQETVTTELRREVLHIEVSAGGPAVYIGDDLLQPGESREVVLYDEQTVVTTEPFVVEEVRIGKRSVLETRQTPVELRYEVLVVDPRVQGAAQGTLSGTQDARPTGTPQSSD
ncbi:YsnF/AvaK domain-containing protein [Deinococcus koreensis]|uniref:DUF2382 domain-containing protein n=1 Tax=Deinococcus koreensis TaxID=2054903 RepID=A0A2K3USK2_9DEIO|nr:YsnF/AvaK domain-containing protein [Deinococcus koreensis]PNY79521.1 hypothetical protein CVO96_19025 [Deinococcus koreensis]